MTYTRDEVISEAVGKAVTQGRPFADHWFYYTNDAQRVHFGSLGDFVASCERQFSFVLE